MPDLTAELLPELRQHRLDGLDLGSEFVYPHYAGWSILNLPATISQLLGAGAFGMPLDAALTGPGGTVWGSECHRVILVLVDALSLHRLQRWMADGSVPVWNRLARQGRLAPLTSVTPSTTSAALASLWTGHSPAEHGIVGYEMWMKEYGLIANTILLSPMSFKNDPGGLARAGFGRENYMPFTPLGSHLAAAGVKAYGFQPHAILDSGLSKSLMRDVALHGYNTYAELWVNLRQLLAASAGRSEHRQFIWVYTGMVDTLSHLYGPDDERPAAEFAAFSAGFERLFLERLNAAACQDTLVILTADHGMFFTPKDHHYELRHHPGLTGRLHMQPTGENRFAYLYLRPGQEQAGREYIERTWPGQFTLLDPAYAVKKGLLGPGSPHPRLAERTGDCLAVANGEAYWWWAEKENLLLGRHGGLHPDEMLVPLLAARL